MDIKEAYINKLKDPYWEGWNRESQKTAQNELANKPRYDITGERYGNTLQDDMFSIKNAGRIKDRHTPESYEYFNREPLDVSEPVSYYNPLVNQENNYQAALNAISNASLPPMNERFGRQKVLGEIPEEYYGVESWDYWPEGESDEDIALVNYLEAKARQRAIDDLRNYGSGYHGKTDFEGENGFPVPYHTTSGNTIADDVRYIKSGGKTFHESGEQSPLSFNPYESLSDAQLENLGWAHIPDIENGETVQDVMAAYQRLLKEHPERIAARREQVGFK